MEVEAPGLLQTLGQTHPQSVVELLEERHSLEVVEGHPNTMTVEAVGVLLMDIQRMDLPTAPVFVILRCTAARHFPTFRLENQFHQTPLYVFIILILLHKNAVEFISAICVYFKIKL